MSHICNFCKDAIKNTKFLSIDNDTFYHMNHFKCCDCGMINNLLFLTFQTEINLSELPYYEKDKKLYCQKDFHKHFSPVCHLCKGLIKEQYISAMGFSYHKVHFNCVLCSKSLLS